MAKIFCRCGHWFRVDSEGAEHYSAEVLPTKRWPRLQDAVLANFYALVEAVKAGKTAAEWANVELSYKPGEEDLLLYRFFGDTFLDLGRSMYQCEKCHRLYLETATPNHFRSFLPEDDDSQGILDAQD